MNNSGKKKQLKEIILNSELGYDLVLYRLIDLGCLDFAIPSIGNECITDRRTGIILSPEEQFIGLLDRLVRIFKSNFIHGVVRCEIILEDFFKSNEEIIKEYLSHRVNLSDGLAENIIQDGLCKIFTNSIIENSKYLENTEKFISNVTFNQKKSKNYNSSKLIRLEEVLSDVTECNKSDYNILYLFITIDYYTDLIYSDLDNNKSYATIQKHVIKKFNKVYDRLLDNYNEKKQFLKYLY